MDLEFLSHLDWALVSYVREQFYKHFVDGLKYVERLPEEEFQAFRIWQVADTSIEDKRYNVYKDAYEYAFDMVERDCDMLIVRQLSMLRIYLPCFKLSCGSCTLPEGRMITNALLQNASTLNDSMLNDCVVFDSSASKRRGDPNYDLLTKAQKCGVHIK